jgi:1-acyl-sn-glycerol-3-phosphate acyltransferase
VIIAANHESHLDPPLIGCGPRRPMCFVARVGLFSFRPLGWLISALNAIPIRQGEADTAAIRAVLGALEAGRPVLIFPEGSRTFDGGLQPFARGITVLLKRSKCPVVPAAVAGCFEAWPRTRSFPFLRGRRVAVVFGAAIGHDELMKDGPDAALALLRERIEGLRLQARDRVNTPAAEGAQTSTCELRKRIER